MLNERQPPNGSRLGSGLIDELHNWHQVYARRNVSLARAHPRVPRAPDVRLSPADLCYDVPEDIDLLTRLFPVLRRIPGVRCEVPAGAFYVFPNVSSF